MQRLAGSIFAQRRFILLAVLFITIAGLFAGLRMPVALFPAVHFPRIVIEIAASERPSERMAIEVTSPVEDALRSLPGVVSVRSITSRGESEISVSFSWNQDMETALLRTEEAVSELQPLLPPGSDVSVRRMDPTVFPCFACSMTSPGRSLGELRHLALTQVRPLLATVAGVARVEVQGGAVDELHVAIDPGRLRAHGLTVDQVADAVAGTDVQTAVGRVEDHGRLFLIVSDTQARSAEELGRIPIRSGDAGIIHLADVARVVPGAQPQWLRVVANGTQAVSLQIFQQDGGNTVAIARDLRARLDSLNGRLPPDIALGVWYDQSQLITSSFASVRDALLTGIVLAAVVLWAWLRSWRITVVALVAVPASLAAAMLAMAALHLDFNIMTLGGLAAAVGLIIDDAIVMVEQAVAQARAQPTRDPVELMRRGLRFAGPLAGSSLATIIIFAPLVFLTGVTGAFFQALAITMATSLAASFLIALLVVPLLTTLLLEDADIARTEGTRWGTAISDGYRACMQELLRRPWLVLVAIIPLLVLGWLSFQLLGTGFMPRMDEGGFVIDYRAQPGTALSECDHLVTGIEDLLRATPEVASWSRRTGAQLGDGLTEANEGDFFVRLRPYPRKPCAEVMDHLRGRIARTVPGLEIDMAQLMEDLIVDLVANPHPIEVILTGEDIAGLTVTARTVAARLSSVRGVVDINDGVVISGESLLITCDRDLAASEDTDPAEVTRQLQDLVGGEVAATIQRGPFLIPTRVLLPSGERSTIDDIRRIEVHGRDGHVFPLLRIAHIDVAPGQQQIDHLDLQRVLTVTANIADRDLGSTVHEVQRLMDRPGMLPAGVHYRLGGLYHEQQVAFRDLSAVLLSATILVFLLLVFLYRSLRTALAISITSVLSLCGVFIGLNWCAVELNISAMMGMTMVVGIGTEVSIIFASAFHSSSGASPAGERLIAAGLSRMRPILMTIVAAALALAPLAMGIGAGAEMQRPLAIAIISGLLVKLPLTVVVLPLLLAWMRVR